MDEHDDSSAAFRSRDVEALRAFDAHVGRLAAALIADPGSADDVAQEARFAAWRRPPGDASRTSGYFARLVARFAANRRREDARRGRRERAASKPESIATAHVAEREEARRRLWEAVEGLDAPYREVVRLGWFDGRKPREMARALGVPVETVRTRQKRALAKLREILDRGYGGRDAWISAFVPLCRAELAAAGTAAFGGVAMFIKAAAVATVLFFGWWNAGGADSGSGAAAESAPSARAGGGASRGAESAAAASPRVPAADAGAIGRDPFAEQESARATFVVLRERGRTPVVDAETALIRTDGTKLFARTDASGAASYPPGQGKALVAVRVGDRPTCVFAATLEAGRKEIVLGEGKTLRGRATVDGKRPVAPVVLRAHGVQGPGDAGLAAGVPAHIWRDGEWTFRRDIATAADGTFVVEGLRSEPERPVQFEPVAQELEVEGGVRSLPRSGHSSAVSIDVAASDAVEPIVPLLTRPTLTGRLLDGAGEAVPIGTEIELVGRVTGRGLGHQISTRSRTQSGGAFALPIPRGVEGDTPPKIDLSARGLPGADANKLSVDGPFDVGRDVGELRLPLMRSVSVVVRNKSGAPVPGAQVRPAAPTLADPAIAGADGAATVTLAPKQIAVRVTAEGCAPVVARCPKDVRDLVVELEPGAIVEFRVTDPSGRPFVDYPVRLVRPRQPEGRGGSSGDDVVRGSGGMVVDSRYEVEVFRITTDAEGVAAMLIARPGDAVTAEVPGAVGEARLISEAERTVRAEVVLPAPRRDFAVRVIDAEGKPVRGVVEFRAPGCVVEISVGQPGADGAHRVRGMPWTSAEVAVSARFNGPAARAVVAPVEGDAEAPAVALPQPRILRFKVVDEHGDPVTHANVQVERNFQGRFADKGDAPGTYFAEDYGEPQSVVIRVGGSRIVRPLEIVDTLQVFTVAPSGVAHVVVDGAGEDDERGVLALVPADGRAEILATPKPAKGGRGGTAEARIDAQVGRYRVEWRRSVKDATLLAPSVEIEVRRNETTDAALKAK